MAVVKRIAQKTILLFVFLVLSVVCLSATEQTEISRKKAVLTAFKNLTVSTSIEEISSFKFYSATSSGNINTEVQSGGSVAVGSYEDWETIFYWVIEGTAFQNVKLAFTFWPLYRGELSTLSSQTPPQSRVIPYQIQLQHVVTIHCLCRNCCQLSPTAVNCPQLPKLNVVAAV